MKQIDCEQLVQDNRQICLRMERLANRFMEAEGLTAVQGHLLLYILLKGDSGTSLTAIHREFGYSKATLSNMLKRLREKGYVRVASCARLTVCKRNCFKISASAQKIISGIKRRNPIYENCIASAWPV